MIKTQNSKHQFEPVVGLEVHVELSTKSKMFCRCKADHFAKKPNTQVCPVCLGMPGALPVPNKKAIEATIKLGLALGCKVATYSKFDRKNYFYPDLPKGFQISQYDMPLAANGEWRMANSEKIRIRRVHLEEDTAKLVHEVAKGEKVSLIDFNRSGVPLAEIVTEPDFDSVEGALAFLKDLQRLVRWIGVAEADMEKGSMRLEANLSLRPAEQKALPGYKVEVKNINSFRFVKRAMGYEIERQKELLEKGEKVIQETRGYDADKGVTFSQRGKEGEADYRYFPEPDIGPIVMGDDERERIKESLPELPWEAVCRLRAEGLREDYVRCLTESRELVVYFEEAVKVGREHGVGAEKIAGVMVNKKVDIERVLPAKLVEVLRGKEAEEGVTDDELEKAIGEVLRKNVKAVGDYKRGKQTVMMFLVGQVMVKTKGRARAEEARRKLEQVLRG